MKLALKNILVKLLNETAQKIDTGNCELTEEEAIEIMSVLSHQPLSKEQAYLYLNMSRSKFDELIRQGVIPKGKKRRGFKELSWYKDTLDDIIFKRQ